MLHRCESPPLSKLVAAVVAIVIVVVAVRRKGYEQWLAFMVFIVDFTYTPMLLILVRQCFRVMLLARSFTVVCCHIIDQKGLNVELGDLYWGRLLLKKHCFLEKISRIMWTKRSFLWHIITRSLFKSTTFLTRFDQEALNGKLGDLSRGSRNTAFLKRFKELCEQKDLSCGILLQESCSKSTAFLTRFTEFMFKKHCLSWQDLQDSMNKNTKDGWNTLASIFYLSL